MKHQSIEQLQAYAAIQPVAAYFPMNRTQRLERWAFDVEQLVLARRMGLRVSEVAVHWRNSPATRVRFWRDASRMLVDIIGVRLRRYPQEPVARDSR